MLNALSQIVVRSQKISEVLLCISLCCTQERGLSAVSPPAHNNALALRS